MTLTANELPTRAGVLDVHVTGVSMQVTPTAWNLFVNGIPVVTGAEQVLSATERASGHFERNVIVVPDQRKITLRAESVTGSSLGFAEQTYDARSVQARPSGRLFIFAAGVSHFQDAAIGSLAYPERDAASMVSTLSELAGGQFTDAPKTMLLGDQKGAPATRSAFDQMKAFLQSARGEDTVVVFLASHGLSDPRGNYYFVPSDAARQDIDAVLAGKPGSGQTLIEWQQIFEALEHTAGHRVLIIDTCSSAAIKGSFDTHSLAKYTLASSFALLAASRGNEESQELKSAQHGLFTYALLEALRTGYDPNHDGRVSLSEAFQYAFDKVQALHNRAVGPQTPEFFSPEVLRDWPLARAGGNVGSVGEVHQ
jgi:hypothetical protein